MEPVASVDEQYWSRFESALATTQFLLLDCDGLVGRHMSQMTSSLLRMTKGIYENWRESWEENPNKGVIQQQMDIMVASKELQKAYKQFLDLLQYRKIQHGKELSVQAKLCRPSTSFGWTRAGGKRTYKLTLTEESDALPGPSKSPPSKSPHLSPGSTESPEFDNNSLKAANRTESSSPDEKKIKEEPIDEDVYIHHGDETTFKEEPVDPAESSAQVKLEDYELEEAEIQEKVKEEPMEDVFNGDTGDARPSGQVDPFYSAPINNHQQESAARPGTSKATAMIAVRGPVSRNAFVSQERQRPFFTRQLVDGIPNNPLKEKYADCVEPRACYLCDQYTSEYYSTPTNVIRRVEFLKRIITLTPNEIARVASLKKNDRRAYFCMKHVAVRDFPGTSAPLPNSLAEFPETAEERQLRERLSIPMKFKPSLNRETISELNIQPPPRAANQPMRKCDLCGGRAWPFSLSPKDQTLAKGFFERLIGLTPPQQERTTWYLQQQRRATLCKSHIQILPAMDRKPTPTVLVKAPMDDELQQMKNRMDRTRPGPIKNALLHKYIKRKKQKEEYEMQRDQETRTSQPISIPARYDVRKSTSAMTLSRASKRDEEVVTEIEAPDLIVVNNSRRKTTYQTVPEECDSIRNLKNLIHDAPTLGDESLNSDLIKEEDYSGIV